MKQLLYFLFCIQLSSFGQCDNLDIVEFPEKDAEFPGGVVEMKRFIVDNIEYPPIAQYHCFPYTGPFYFEFIVCDNGSIHNVRLIKPSESTSDYVDLIKEMIEKMPNWVPAENQGKRVATKCRLPVTICLF